MQIRMRKVYGNLDLTEVSRLDQDGEWLWLLWVAETLGLLRATPPAIVFYLSRYVIHSMITTIIVIT